MSDFSVNKETLEDITKLSLSGSLDAHTVEEFESVIKSCIENGEFRILVNLNDLDYISSAGLGVFMGYINTIRENGGDIKLTNLGKNVLHVFELIGFNRIYDIFNTEKEAIRSFSSDESSGE